MNPFLTHLLVYIALVVVASVRTFPHSPAPALLEPTHPELAADDTDDVVEDDTTSASLEEPGPVAALRVTPTSTTIQMDWDPSPGVVDGYKVGWGRGTPDVEVVFLPNTSRSFFIDNLEPRAPYVVGVRAFNDAGTGIVTYEVLMTQRPERSTSTPSL